MTSIKLTPTQARRLAITRQRLAGERLAPTAEGMMALFRELGCVQIDSIRAVERTQYLVLWSRLGSYDRALLDQLQWQDKKLFEYWAHAASICLTENYPIHQYRMSIFSDIGHAWNRRLVEWAQANEPFQQYILDEMKAHGPRALKDLEDRSDAAWTSGGWTTNRNVSMMIEYLWAQGQVMVAERKGLQKKWTLAEDWLPAWTLQEVLSDQEVTRRAAQIALRALGVGTAKHIRNHFTRSRYPDLDVVLDQLLAEGRILAVDIADWPGQWYLHSHDLLLLDQLAGDAWQPRTVLLSPFDNLIADRDRTELMWDFRYRIEIYVPKAKRQYGYCVLPILHGDRFIGRIDPKMDRKSNVLHINAVYAEPDAPQDEATGRAVAAAIEDLARFLAAKSIDYGDNLPAGWRLALRAGV